ncbi:hypothetical protein J6590_000095 [Homalodisca vitripennis]|nr:hypothetical protein J6590_000095 [Homalodisca vitripennis]
MLWTSKLSQVSGHAHVQSSAPNIAYARGALRALPWSNMPNQWSLCYIQEIRQNASWLRPGRHRNASPTPPTLVSPN